MFLTKRFYIALTITILAVAMGYVFPVMFVIGKALVFTLLAAVLTELAMLYYKWQGIDAARTCSQRFSNGDDNEVSDQPLSLPCQHAGDRRDTTHLPA